jgi:hypothetical protein
MGRQEMSMEARLPLRMSKVVSPTPSVRVWSVRESATWRARGPSITTVCGVLLVTVLSLLGVSGGVIRLRESEKRARAGEVLKGLSRANEAVLGQIRNDLLSSVTPSITVADKATVRLPEDGVPYHTLTIRSGKSGPNHASHRILYAFLSSADEIGDGRDNDHNGLVDEGLLLRWDERSGPKIIGRDLLDVAFTRHGTELEVRLCAAAKQHEAPPLVQCATTTVDLMAP